MGVWVSMPRVLDPHPSRGLEGLKHKSLKTCRLRFYVQKPKSTKLATFNPRTQIPGREQQDMEREHRFCGFKTSCIRAIPFFFHLRTTTPSRQSVLDDACLGEEALTAPNCGPVWASRVVAFYCSVGRSTVDRSSSDMILRRILTIRPLLRSASKQKVAEK